MVVDGVLRRSKKSSTLLCALIKSRASDVGIQTVQSPGRARWYDATDLENDPGVAGKMQRLDCPPI